MLQALAILEQFDFSGYTPESPEYLALLAKALEAAQLSTDHYVADPAFVDVPVAEMLTMEWYSAEAAAIREGIQIGNIRSDLQNQALLIPKKQEHVGNTTHLSVVDKSGNMVALTQTINYFFGSGVFVSDHGFFLNNEMADFTYNADSINLPQPGKRPKSSIAPVIVMKDGQPIAAIGSPGGRRIPSALVQILVRCIDFEQDLQTAIDAPRLYVDSALTRIAYEPRYPDGVIDTLSAILAQEKDWEFQEKEKFDKYFGGAQGVWIRDAIVGPKLEGAADPRRGGAVSRTGKPSMQ